MRIQRLHFGKFVDEFDEPAGAVRTHDNLVSIRQQFEYERLVSILRDVAFVSHFEGSQLRELFPCR